MQMLAEEILSQLSVKQDRRIASGLTPISDFILMGAEIRPNRLSSFESGTLQSAQVRKSGTA
jgi:hypothetical protein